MYLGFFPISDVEVFLDSNNNFVKGEAAGKFYLYDSLRLFYANGGGNCYIISVGEYLDLSAEIPSKGIEDGLDALAEEDEPTIILLPDAVSIAGIGLYSVQQKALKQCKDLMDRVLVCDVLKAKNSTDFSDNVEAFRTGIGINSLKYGAAYGPWIYANLPRHILRKNLILKRDGTGASIELESLTTDQGITDLIRDIKLAEAGDEALEASVADIISTITGAEDKGLNDALLTALDQYRAIPANSDAAGTLSTALQDFTNLIFAALEAIQKINHPDTPYPDPDKTKFNIRETTASYLDGNSGLKKSILELVSHHNLQGINIDVLAEAVDAAVNAFSTITLPDGNSSIELQTLKDAIAAINNADPPTDATSAVAAANAAIDVKNAFDAFADIPIEWNAAEAVTAAAHAAEVGMPIENIVFADSSLDAAAILLGFQNTSDLLSDTSEESAAIERYETADTIKKRADVVRDAAYSAAQNAITMFNSIRASVDEFEKTLNDALLASFGKFKELVTKGAEALNLLPPSGAIAGVYAAVDSERGVWKAPANVSLNAVIAPAVKITAEQQKTYNVDANAGKSINIIRSFTGKGTLVWGARTLAGNDNEWRYVSVRRFFNFAEESIKKATEQFVFEPNDANTWVRVQAMIENFLTTQWRQGALQGVKPGTRLLCCRWIGKNNDRSGHPRRKNDY